MKKTVVAVGLVGALALSTATAFAWGPGRGWGYGSGPYAAGPAAPNLTPEQTAKLQKVQADRFAEAAKLRSEMYAKQLELRNLFRQPTLDQAKITAKQKEIAALQAQLAEKGQAARLAAAEVLTPEQRAQLPAYGPGMGKGFGRGMGKGFGPRW